MKRSVLTLAAFFSFLSFTIGCKDAERDTEENVDLFETTTGADSEMNSTSNQKETKELENTDLVDSGTYTGTAEIVDQQQKEVYVRLNDTTIIELYFSNNTQVMQNGQKVPFNSLQEGQKLEVEVQRNGDELSPQRVTILQ